MAYTEASYFRFGARVQEHLKIRLTGAIILVIVVVLLVPEMFRGRPPGGAARGGATVDELPLRSYTIDLRRNSAPQGDAVVGIPGPVAPAVAPSAVAEVPANVAPTAPPASLMTKSTAAPTPTPAPAPASAPAPAPTSAPAPQPAARAAAAASVSAARPVAAGAATGARWTVQVGSFSRRDFAERMVKQVRARGFAVVAVGPDERGLYRVRSAAVNARASAEALRQKMLAQGLKPIVSTAP